MEHYGRDLKHYARDLKRAQRKQGAYVCAVCLFVLLGPGLVEAVCQLFGW